MRNLLIPAALAMCAPIFAQSTTKSFTAPDGFETTEGAHYGYYTFYTPQGKFQSIEGERRGTPRVFSGIQFRRDSTYTVSSYTNVGRSWTSVSIQMSNSDFAKASSNVAGNQTSTPTTVWSSNNFSLPTFTTSPTIKNPAVWGGLKGEFNFNFSTVWLYDGKQDFATTWDFQGGKLANGYVTTFGAVYYLDGEYINTSSSYIQGTYVPATRAACNDSTMTYTTGAYTYAYGYVYGKYGTTVNYRNKGLIYCYSYYTAPGSSVLQALGAANPTGVNVGAKCNPLYVNAAYPMVLVAFATAPFSGNQSGYSGSYYHIFPWLPFMKGLTAMAQTAWTDSKTSQFALTSGMQMQFPNGPPPDVLPNRTAVYPSGTNYYMSNSGYVNPITRYLHR